MSFFKANYTDIKEEAIHGRYLTHEHILPLIKNLNTTFRCTEIGKSVNGIPIDCIEFGSGATKIFMWSQMHGNESTTTKAVFDLLNFIKSKSPTANEILEKCTVRIIPMLNPDGAAAYTRHNANEIDLNRDALDLSQPESNILREAYTDFQPDFCFNLHDQRTMYNVGGSDKPATVSFLAPAFDQACSMSSYRENAMALILQMNIALQKLIPGQIGRYDDAFNPNCVGDAFQKLQTPTVLFEAGHFPGDYERERTREFVFIALVEAIGFAIKDNQEIDYARYFAIPENDKKFFDVLIAHPHYIDEAYDKGLSLGIRFEEKLVQGAIQFIPKIDTVFGKGTYYGHQSFDCSDEISFKNLKEEGFFAELFVLI